MKLSTVISFFFFVFLGGGGVGLVVSVVLRFFCFFLVDWGGLSVFSVLQFELIFSAESGCFMSIGVVFIK